MWESSHSALWRRVFVIMLLVVVACDVSASSVNVFVDPVEGDDSSLGEASSAVRTVHAAAARVRQLLVELPGVDITVQLLPGIHHVGDRALVLGEEDGGAAGGGVVTWRSLGGAADPATISAAIRVTGWQAHKSVKQAFSAPLPANISRGTVLRQFWVKGMRAERPKIYGHGRQPGDNREGHCLNLTNVTRTPMYPEGSQFDFSDENATDPSTWLNPEDVEFVYTSCDAINCWIEPRCTVEKVEGSKVSLKQSSGNSSCFHRLYYYAQCFNNGHGPGRQGKRGQNPTHLENVAANFSYPGQFYYDRADGSIGYIPRSGETVADLEATATTATQQELLVVNSTANLRWENIKFE